MLGRELSLEELATGASPLELNPVGRPEAALAYVNLDRLPRDPDPVMLASSVATLERGHVPVIGLSTRPLTAGGRTLAVAMDVTLVTADGRDVPETCVALGDVDAGLDVLETSSSGRAKAAAVLCQTVRVTSGLPVHLGLVVESMAYSMLLASEEFQEWRSTTPRRRRPAAEDPVRLSRDGSALRMVLDDPDRRNAYSRHMRDGLVEGLDLAAWDDSIRHVSLSGAGPSFCSGGDLDEFGTVDDVSVAHLIRLRQGAGAALERVRERVTVDVHGACIGAGIEIPAFASSLVAHPATTFRLPELAMGLIPGAGGTVSITRRIGRWRTAWLALTGEAIDVNDALGWGLIDGIA
ncbi:enoyl-CoA hydratase/isomerase family protein [Knoellia aerolata]|uniref:enoyl-CoA hydratase/isomerase family protein n=1 Tax=Knoellia aerolata TaxID=442954 RepID=UPI00056B8360|nr:enoyl-CoA hydratase/isomerase family protein [Knoellia aerolata]